jgi:hypothetical protein
MRYAKSKLCYLLGITLLFAFVFWLLKTNTIIESYNSGNMSGQLANIAKLDTNPDDANQYFEYDPTFLSKYKTITFYDKNSLDNVVGDYDLTSITTDILNNNPNKQISWKNVDVISHKKNILKITPKPKVKFMITDTCSVKSFLNSNFKEDFCEKYLGDDVTLNNKCKELSPDNCKIPSCCVLLNGTKCVGGNMHGPTYTSDSEYYHNKQKCYGNCRNYVTNEADF